MGALRPTSDTVGFVRTIVRAIRNENLTFMAGSLAYHAFISLIPLVALLFLSLAVFGSEQFAERVLVLSGSLLSPEANRILQQHLVSGAVSGTAGASVIGLATLLWGSLKVFRSLDIAFSVIYGTTDDTTFVGGIVDALVVLVTIPVSLLIVVVVTIVLSLLRVTSIQFVSPVVLVFGLVLTFLPLYYFFPNTDVSVREVLPGVAVAAVGWMVLQQLFQVYVVLAGTSAGSLVGAVILFLTWLYFAGVVLLIGGVVNAVHGGYHEQRSTPA